MSKSALLVLEDGTVFRGTAIGAEGISVGEVVFNTSMTGYQEMLTDPSYRGQILIPTYPMIGNYGISEIDIESDEIQVSGFVVRQYCEMPSHNNSLMNIHEYLLRNNVPGIYGLDTRSIVKKIRNYGVMMGSISSENNTNKVIDKLNKISKQARRNFGKKFSNLEEIGGGDASDILNERIKRIKLL